MPDIPDAVVDAAMAAEVEYARTRRPDGRGHAMPPRDQVRRLLEAAAPLLARNLLRPLLERHPRIEGGWGPCCGACWVRGGSRAAWPCAEVLAISVLLPIPDEEVPDAE